MSKYLYHGSPTSGIQEFLPKESGYDEKFVYATTELAMALIFAGDKRNTFEASWGTDRQKNKIPFFIEKKKGVFDKWYKNRSGSIYFFTKKDFEERKMVGSDSHARISKKKVKPVKELIVPDLKSELLKLRKEGKIKITFYRSNLKEIQEPALLKSFQVMVEKYGYERTAKQVKLYYPKLVSKLKK